MASSLQSSTASTTVSVPAEVSMSPSSSPNSVVPAVRRWVSVPTSGRKRMLTSSSRTAATTSPAAQMVRCPPGVRLQVSAPTSGALRSCPRLCSQGLCPRSVHHLWKPCRPRQGSSSPPSSQTHRRPPPVLQLSSTWDQMPCRPRDTRRPCRQACCALLLQLQCSPQQCDHNYQISPEYCWSDHHHGLSGRCGCCYARHMERRVYC
jgi:hypothetical protein